MRKMSTSTKIKLGVSVLLILGVLWLAGPSAVADTLNDVDLALIFIVVVLYIIGLVLKSYRWGVLLNGTGKKVPFRSTLAAFTFSQALNNIIPGRVVGETSRIFEIKNNEGVSVGSCLATVVTERVMDLLVVTALAVTSLAALLTYFVGETRTQLLLVVAAMVVANIAFIYVLAHPTLAVRLGEWAARKLRRMGLGTKGEKLAKYMTGFTCSFAEALHPDSRQTRKTMAWAGLLTCIIWTIEIARLFLIILALGADVTLLAVIATVSLVSLSSIVLSAGSSNIVISSAIFTACGLDPSVAATAGLLSAMTSIWLSVPISLIALAYYEKTKKPSGSLTPAQK
jgi:uncharacterized protein (TIRG00374 family)